jgi:hypothetical protein
MRLIYCLKSKKSDNNGIGKDSAFTSRTEKLDKVGTRIFALFRENARWNLIAGGQIAQMKCFG